MAENPLNLLQKKSHNLQNWRSVELFKKGNGYNSEVQQQIVQNGFSQKIYVFLVNIQIFLN